MLNRKPIGANQKAIANWEATNRMTIEMFKAFWQRVSPDLEFPGTQAGEEASHAEWEGKDSDGDDCKFQGMRKPDGGQKHGIVRTIDSDYGWIYEETYCDDKEHGLSFSWWNDDGYAFEAAIYDHGEYKARISWESDWSEAGSNNKEMILENNGLSIFKP